MNDATASILDPRMSASTSGKKLMGAISRAFDKVSLRYAYSNLRVAARPGTVASKSAKFSSRHIHVRWISSTKLETSMVPTRLLSKYKLLELAKRW